MLLHITFTATEALKSTAKYQGNRIFTKTIFIYDLKYVNTVLLENAIILKSIVDTVDSPNSY